MVRTLAEIIQGSANLIPCVTVTIDRIGNVCISDDAKNNWDIFMSSTDADNFVAECDYLYKKVQFVDMGVIELHVAKPYVDNLWN